MSYQRRNEPVIVHLLVDDATLFANFQQVMSTACIETRAKTLFKFVTRELCLTDRLFTDTTFADVAITAMQLAAKHDYQQLLLHLNFTCKVLQR
jgi:hypothetical protein